MTATKRMLPFVLFQTLLTIAAGCSCEEDQVKEDGSNTNWLSYCEASADCEGDGSCICGLCTDTCETDAMCARSERPASCVEPEPASEAGGCAAVVRDAKVKICLPDCTGTEDCRDKSSCIDDACWPDADDIIDERALSPSVVDRDAGSPDAAVDAAEPGYLHGVDVAADLASPDYFQGMDAAMDFSEPIQLPEPETVIGGDFSESSLVGIWQQEASSFWGGSIRLVIERAVDGRGLVGSVSFLCEDERCDPMGPPPPATDPDTGYPPELDARDQDMLRINILPRFDYRIFDARVEEQRFSFWFTNNDLWRDWCALQTPYPVDNGGRLEYHCLPDPKPYDDLSYDSHPQDVADKELLCAADHSVCACGQEACNVSFRGSVRAVDLFIDGDVMGGVFVTDLFDTIPVTLHKMEGPQS